MVESEFVLLGTEVDDSGVPWALLARDRGGELEFAGPAIFRLPSTARAEWIEKFSNMAMEKPALRGLRRANKAQWFKPEAESGRNTSRPRVRSDMRRSKALI